MTCGELERRLERALSTLSPQRREVLLLVGHEGLARSWPSDEAPFERTIGPAIGAAWCLVYVVEIVRRTAAVSGLFGTR